MAGNHEHDGGKGRPNLGQVQRVAATAAGLLALVLVGGLVLRAGSGLVSNEAQPSGPLLFGAPAAATATDTPVPAPTATDTPLAQSTPTPTPTLAPPTPTPTPAPDPVVFTCASAAGGWQGVADEYGAQACISTLPNRTVSIGVSYCGQHHAQFVGITTQADGTGSVAWQFWATCALPFTVSLDALNTDQQTPRLAGSTSFTATGPTGP